MKGICGESNHLYMYAHALSPLHNRHYSHLHTTVTTLTSTQPSLLSPPHNRYYSHLHTTITTLTFTQPSLLSPSHNHHYSHLHTTVTTSGQHMWGVGEKNSHVYKGGVSSKLFESLARLEAMNPQSLVIGAAQELTTVSRKFH